MVNIWLSCCHALFECEKRLKRLPDWKIALTAGCWAIEFRDRYVETSHLCNLADRARVVLEKTALLDELWRGYPESFRGESVTEFFAVVGEEEFEGTWDEIQFLGGGYASLARAIKSFGATLASIEFAPETNPAAQAAEIPSYAEKAIQYLRDLSKKARGFEPATPEEYAEADRRRVLFSPSLKAVAESLDVLSVVEHLEEPPGGYTEIAERLDAWRAARDRALKRVQAEDRIENRLAFAEVIGELDEPRAEFIRLQCGVYRTKAGRPRRTNRQQTSLLKKYGERWLLWLTELQVKVEHVVFEHGFIEQVTFHSPRYFADYVEIAFDTAPLLKHVVLNHAIGSANDKELNYEHLLEPAILNQLESLTLLHCGLAVRLEQFASAERWQNLQSLTIGFDDFGEHGLNRLAGHAGQFPHLRELVLGPCGITVGLESLGTSRFAAQLESLEFSNNPIGDDGLTQLLGCPWPKLQELTLVNCQLTTHSAELLLATAMLPNLRLLTVGAGEFTTADIARLQSRFDHVRIAEPPRQWELAEPESVETSDNDTDGDFAADASYQLSDGTIPRATSTLDLVQSHAIFELPDRLDGMPSWKIAFISGCWVTEFRDRLVEACRTLQAEETATLISRQTAMLDDLWQLYPEGFRGEAVSKFLQVVEDKDFESSNAPVAFLALAIKSFGEILALLDSEPEFLRNSQFYKILVASDAFLSIVQHVRFLYEDVPQPEQANRRGYLFPPCRDSLSAALDVMSLAETLEEPPESYSVAAKRLVRYFSCRPECSIGSRPDG